MLRCTPARPRAEHSAGLPDHMERLHHVASLYIYFSIYLPVLLSVYPCIYASLLSLSLFAPFQFESAEADLSDSCRMSRQARLMPKVRTRRMRSNSRPLANTSQKKSRLRRAANVRLASCILVLCVACPHSGVKSHSPKLHTRWKILSWYHSHYNRNHHSWRQHLGLPPTGLTGLAILGKSPRPLPYASSPVATKDL